MTAVTVIDYDMCNLLNTVRALEHCGANVRVVDKASEVAAADRLVVPGVGAFPDCLRELRVRGFDESIMNFAASGRPLLGICIGMQALFDESEEFGKHEGLGLITGAVKVISPIAPDGTAHRVPHIGWTHLALPPSRKDWRESILRGIGPSPAMYFVHSYAAVPADDSDRLADAEYAGRRMCAAVQRANVTGVQFHPERSAAAGLAILRSFLAQ